MNGRAVFGLAIGLWAGGGGLRGAALSPQEFLRRAEVASPRVAYTGRLQVAVYQAPGRAVTSEVQVEADGQGRERREYRSGPAQGLVVLTDGTREWRREPGATAWTVQTRLPESEAERRQRLEQLFRNYQVSFLRREPVAGRTTQAVQVTPRHPGNPSRIFWIDVRTFLPLRIDQFNCEGQLHTRSQYLQVVWQPPLPARLQPPPASSVVPGPPSASLLPCRSRAEMERATGRPAPIPHQVPPGYALTGYFMRPCRQGGYLPVLRYSDGLNLLTVFENRPPARGWGRGWRWRWGQQRECSIQETLQQKVIRLRNRQRSFLVIGDHDRQALQRLAESIP